MVRYPRLSLWLALAVVLLTAVPAQAARAPHADGPTHRPGDAGAPAGYVEDELIVRFAAGASASARADVRRRHGLDRVRDLALPGLELVRFRGQGGPPERARLVGAERAVRYAQPNHVWTAADTAPTDPELGELWGLHNDGQPVGYENATGTPDADIDAPEGWTVTSGSEDVVVAVIDTGVWTDHPDLVDTIWTNEAEAAGTAGVDDDGNGYVDDVHGWDFRNDDATVFDETDADSHGTHVAGTIAATWDNAAGVAGVSRARIMPLKFLGPGGGRTSDAVDALDYAIQMGAHLSNNSWTGASADTALQDMIAEAGAAGQLFVAAAGNGGSDGVGDDTDAQAIYPASFDLDNVVSVAATDRDDDLAAFSNHGSTTVDLGAPGVTIYSTVPDLAKSVHVDPASAAVGYHAAYHSFGLEGVPSTSHREDLVSAALSGWMGLDPSSSILVVDDDGGAGFETAYTDALSSLGYSNATTVETSTGGANVHGPTAEQMAAHAAVLWQTGAAAQDTLTSTDQTELTDYLTNRGGKLLLFGRDIDCDLTDWPPCGEGPVANSFLNDVLRSHVAAEYDRNFRAVGEPGSPYASLATVELEKGLSGSGQTFAGGLTPLAGGVAGLRGYEYSWSSGTSMAAPHVSGAAAQLLASYPDAGHLDVKTWLMDRGDPLTSLESRTVSGKRLNLAGALDTPGDTVTAVAASPAALSHTGSGTDIGWTQLEPLDVTVSIVASTSSTAVRTEALGALPATDRSWTWDGTADDGTPVADGVYHVTVTGVDARGVTVSGTTAVEVVSDAAPSVSITSPPDGATVSGSVSVSADASDDVAVSEVEFLVDGVVEATDGSSPYGFSWDSTAVGDGAHTLTARATDTSSKVTVSDPVSVTVDNADPSDDPPSDDPSSDDPSGDDPPSDDPTSGGTTGDDPSSDTPLIKALGGEAALSRSLLDALTSLTGAPTSRLAGADRYATAAAIVADAFPGTVDTVYVATGADFPDALAGSAAAAHVGAPVLLVARDAVPDPIATQLTRLGPRTVKVLGGPAAVSDATVRTIGDLTGATVRRIAGADRYATAAAVVADAFPRAVSTVYVATGANFPDALAGSAAAAELGAPVVLVAQGSVPDPVAEQLQRLAPSQVRVLGGRFAVSDDTVQRVVSLTGASVRRLAGSDRYATAAAIVADAFPGTATVAYLATGTGFPDALAGSAAAGEVGAPVLLSTHGTVPDPIAVELERLFASR